LRLPTAARFRKDHQNYVAMSMAGFVKIGGSNSRVFEKNSRDFFTPWQLFGFERKGRTDSREI
jgi:hypothetical protein